MAPIAITPDTPSSRSPIAEGESSYFARRPPNGSHRHARGYADVIGDGLTAGDANDINGQHNGQRCATEGIPNGTIPTAKHMRIAIVGMACRMPGNVASPAEFWELLSRARTGFTHIPKRRFGAGSFYHPNPGKAGCFNPVGGNFLDVDLAAFDAPFFGLTEKEAISMDPQQRLLLECTFEALENAGIPKHTVVGTDVGVFVGGSFPEYESHLFRDSDTIPMHQATGCAYAMQSNRISHFFDLRGPSFTSDTACSSSIVALHLACQSLFLGESNVALVGGCHLNMLPEFWISFSTCRLLSDSGQSVAFDERGTGFGRGEGCGMLVLKPLEHAIRDNDPIRAVIAGTGINQDGKTPGITMPSGEAQEALIRRVYWNNGLDPKDCGYVEAHGTGTKVGDPLEAAALYNALGQGRSSRDPLYIGSVKSNIGHLEGASGIAGVMKAALMLERGFILPNYDFKKPNPKIPWKEWNLKVSTNQRPWPKGKKYISVNNFGFGGTNGHVVLEAAPFKQKSMQKLGAADRERSRKLFAFTANDKNALSALMKNTIIYLEQRPEVFQSDLMDNVAYTLGQRRSLLQYRAALPAEDSFSLIEALSSEHCTIGKVTGPLRIGFIFTGQGAQWHAMGRELYNQYPVFASSIDLADRCLCALGAEWSLVEELNRDAEASRVSDAQLSQPSCTAIQLALTDLLRTWGVCPIAVAGHSSGEIGAAYAAGIVTFEAALAIAYHRGRLIPILKKRYPELRGRMMVVGGCRDEVQPLIDGLQAKEVRIACFNSPSSLTISGDESALAELEKVVDGKQMFNRRLVVETAYHSHHMNLVARDYRASILKLSAPTESDIKFHSSLYGHPVKGTELQPQYWVDNLTCPVRFSEAVQSMLEPDGEHKTGVDMLVELGPHSALQGPIKQILKAVGGAAAKVAYASALIRKTDAVESAMDLAAMLFSKGANLDFGAINFPIPGKQPVLMTDLPRYPWNHERKYWQESRMTEKHKHRSAPRSDILGTEAIYSNDLEPTWRNIVRLDDLPWLRQHRIQSLTVFPMAAFIVMALEAAAQKVTKAKAQLDRIELRDVSVVKPLVITDEDVEMTITLRPHQEGSLVQSDTWDEFRICSWSDKKGWTEHCVGLVAGQAYHENLVDGTRQRSVVEAALRDMTEKIKHAGPPRVVRAALYDALVEAGIDYGPAFQGIQDCCAADSCSIATLVPQDIAKDMPSGHLISPIIHPSFLESLIETYWPLLGAGRAAVRGIYLPSSVARVSFTRSAIDLARRPSCSMFAYCRGEPAKAWPRPARVTVFATEDESSLEPLITLEDLTISPMLDGRTRLDAETPRELCFKIEWEPILEPLDEANGATNRLASLPDSDMAIIHENSNFQNLVAMGLAAELELLTGRQPEFGTMNNINANGRIVIFLSELHRPILADLSMQQFDALQKVLTTAEGIVWVVRGAYDKCASPEANMVVGLSRAIRSETAMRFATLDLDSQPRLSEHKTAKAILKVLHAAFGSASSDTSELEYMERKGSFFTPRIVNDKEMNVYVHKQTNPSILEPTPFGKDDRPLKLAVHKDGVSDSPHFVDDQAGKKPLLSDEIEIEVKAVAVNYRDITILKAQGSGDELGIEVSGRVARVGSTDTRFQPGDRVVALTRGGFATRARTKADLAFEIPEGLPFEEAAAMPLAYSTAYHSLIELARLAEGESVLIHAATDGVGQAAVTIAQMIGAEVFVTVGSLEEKKLIMSEYGLCEGRIFFSRDTAFSSGIRGITGNRGVDVVLNCLSGDLLRTSWDCLSKFGRFIDIGAWDRGKKTSIDMSRENNNASFFSVDMFTLMDQRPRQMKRLMAEIARLIKYGKARPATPVTISPVSDIDTAFKILQTRGTSGKMVIAPRAEDIVSAPTSRELGNLLQPEATYILAGGTGGLGRSMARWMVAKGARSIVLVGRGGKVAGKLKELVDDMGALGANIVVRGCNVVDRAEVDDLVANGLVGLPPIRGVIHGTMVLRDTLYEKMTFEDYRAVIEGKVQGGWNLHHAFSAAPLDFFVAISSAAGAVGNRGQAAYAAANCFLNALVQHRLALGLPASSLDLTMVSDSGYLADNKEKLAEVGRNLGSDSICEAEVLALLGAAISGKLAVTCNNHTITGMRITPAMQPFWTRDAKFKHLRLAMEVAVAADGGDTNKGPVSFTAALRSAESAADAEEIVRRGLVDKISAVLMLEAEDMDVTRSLSHYPLDSLVAIEIRNFITREFEANMQVLELLSSGSIQTLAKAVCAKSKLVSSS